MRDSFSDDVVVNSPRVSRRTLLNTLATTSTFGAFSFRQLMAAEAEALRKRGKSMILLWMQGGPSQFETFDPKPGTENGGPTEAIKTAVPGIEIADNFPRLAQMMGDLAIVRSMSNKEGSHPRATYQMHTGYIPSGSVKHPSLGSCIVQQSANPDCELPSFVSVGSTQGAGFLGMDYEPFVVNTPGQLPSNVAIPVADNRFRNRLNLLHQIDEQFAATGANQIVASHQSLYSKSSLLVKSTDIAAFDTSDEPLALQQQYGNSNFGKGCLLARRLVEKGVTFVEVRSGSWDSHQDNFEQCANNAAQVDPATATLIADLKDRGLLDDTLVVWMGEFGRTPRINPRTGRDHYPRVFSIMMAGGGIVGGQVYGASTADGSAIKHSPVSVQDLFQTICASLSINPGHENLSPLGRPMKIVDGGQVIPGFLA